MKFVPTSVLLLLAWLAGCTDNGVGRKCILPPGDGGASNITSTEITAPALECPSRLCLIEPPQGPNPPRATCTAQCTTDADCGQAVMGTNGDGLCATNFVCAAATAQGAFKCLKVCICKTDLVCGLNSDESGNVITPPSCPNGSPAPHCPIVPGPTNLTP
jgi:hypothetical protein